jgi:hypothetical protein
MTAARKGLMRNVKWSIVLLFLGGCSASPDPGGGGYGGGTSGDPSSGATSGGSSAADGGSSNGSNGSAPTWTEIYATYLASGTEGHCVNCHSSASSASAAYALVQSGGYVNGTQSTVSHLFSWMGGIMPPGGPASDTKGTAAVKAWVAAGALDN